MKSFKKITLAISAAALAAYAGMAAFAASPPCWTDGSPSSGIVASEIHYDAGFKAISDLPSADYDDSACLVDDSAPRRSVSDGLADSYDPEPVARTSSRRAMLYDVGCTDDGWGVSFVGFVDLGDELS